MADTKRIRLTRSIILNGGEHAEQDEIHDAPAALAHRLVGEGSAEYVNEEEQPTSVNRMAAPGNADPRTTRVTAGRAPRVHGSESYDAMQKRVEGERGKGSNEADDFGDGDDDSKAKGKGQGQGKK